MRFPLLRILFKLSDGDHTRILSRAYACTDAYKCVYGREQTNKNAVANLRKDKQSCKSFPLILCEVSTIDIRILMWYLCVRIEEIYDLTIYDVLFIYHLGILIITL